jgi:hypothetical protein
VSCPYITIETSCDEGLAWLSKEWKAPVYAFFEPVPQIGYEAGRRFHSFKCAARGCKQRIHHYLDTNDHGSTGNLRKHAKTCWGTEAVEMAGTVKTAAEARENVVKPLQMNGSITAVFERTNKGKVTYSHRQHTKAETKYVMQSVSNFNQYSPVWTGWTEPKLCVGCVRMHAPSTSLVIAASNH